MKPLITGILAHVDAGKTTLSEAMLYCTGRLKRLGRVDHRESFLDTHSLERARGITIFSKQARLTAGNTEITLLDTPGHVDFSPETERTLPVLDCAVLVISGTDGVQAHTLTLWQLLRRYHVPTFLFINKMDLPGCDAAGLMQQIKQRLCDSCVNFSQSPQQTGEEAALCSEGALEEFVQTGQVCQRTLAELVAREQLFPCFFGSALRLSGVEALLSGLDSLTSPPVLSRPILRPGLSDRTGSPGKPPDLSEGHRRLPACTHRRVLPPAGGGSAGGKGQRDPAVFRLPL